MKLFDSHCHMDDERFDEDREEVFHALRESGVAWLTCVASDLKTSESCRRFAASHPGVYATCGVHPHEAKDAPADYIDQLAAMCRSGDYVALGEIGLDYYYDLSPRDVQKRVLNEQLDLATALNMPCVFHIRDAHGDMLDIFRARRQLPDGIIHCFSGSAETAREYLKMGFYISFAGPLTFRNAVHLREACQAVPLDRLLIETDSPYLAPEPVRGKRNNPANVRYVCMKAAELHHMDADAMAEITAENAMRVYRIRNQDAGPLSA